MGRRFKKKDVALTLTHKDAIILEHDLLAKARRNYGGTSRRFTNFTSDSSLSAEDNLINFSEYIETLIGEDDWCGQDIQDKNVVDLTDDEILSELETNEDNSIVNILQRWRDSALRQEESFVRRGDSERNKRLRMPLPFVKRASLRY